jgi:signal transduction histidine kinase
MSNTDRDPQSRRLEVLGRLAGGAAHELNNLLAVVLNYSAFVADAATGPTSDDRRTQVSRDIGYVRDAGAQAARHTRPLAAFAERPPSPPESLDVNETVRDLEELLRACLGSRVELILDLAATRCPAYADPGEIELAVVELVLDGRDAMPSGGRLTVDTTNLADGGAHVRLRVRTNGDSAGDTTRSVTFPPGPEPPRG